MRNFKDASFELYEGKTFFSEKQKECYKINFKIPPKNNIKYI